MDHQNVTGLSFIGFAIVIILAGIAASISPMGVGAAIIGLLLAVAGLARIR